MSAPFFIAGLPRSRTAWLANWFTADGSDCAHDAWRWCSTPKAIREQMPAGHDWVGTADSLNGPRYEQLVQEFGHEVPFAVVERDPLQASYAVLDLFQGAVSLGEIFDEIKHLTLAHTLLPKTVMRVPFEALEDPETIRAMERHLTPGRIFDERRWRLLDELKVEIIMSKYA